MPETKGGNAERLKQQSFLLPQRLSSKEVIVKQLRGVAGPGVVLGGRRRRKALPSREAQVMCTGAPQGRW